MNNAEIFDLVNSLVTPGLTAAELSESLHLKRAPRTALCEAELMKNPGDDGKIQREYTQYVKAGNSYRPSGDVVLTDNLDACAYQVNLGMMGVSFERVKPQTDELMVFENSSMQQVVQEIDKFWERKKQYQDLGLMHSRGILMYGSPGTGKSAALQQVVEMMVKRGDVVFFAKSSEAVVEGLKAFRQVEPNRRVVVCFEEADELVRYNERALLQLMDGDAKTDNVLYLATTNHLDRLPPRMLRPGRFDKKICIQPPAFEARLKYLKHKLSNLAEDSQIAYLAKESAGFGFGHLRELVAGIYAMGEPAKDVLDRLRAPVYESSGPARESGMSPAAYRRKWSSQNAEFRRRTRAEGSAPGPKVVPTCKGCKGSGKIEPGMVWCEVCGGMKKKTDEAAGPNGPVLHSPILKPMDHDDRAAFAGAEGPDGGEPLISDIDLDGMPGQIIVGRNDTQVILTGPDDNPLIFSLQTPYAQGRALAAQLVREQPPIDRLAKDFGFDRLG